LRRVFLNILHNAYGDAIQEFREPLGASGFAHGRAER